MYQRSPLWDFSGRDQQFQSTVRSKWSDRLAKLREFAFPSWSAKHAAYVHKAESSMDPAEMGAGSSASPSAAASPPPSSSSSSPSPSEDRSKPKQEHKEQQQLQIEDDVISIVAADDPVRVVVSTSPASPLQDLVIVLSADSSAATSVDGVSNDGADLHIVVEPLSTSIDDPAPPLTASIAMAASIPPTAPLPELVKKTLGVPSLSATTSTSSSSIPSSSSSGQAPSFAPLRKLPTISHLHDQTTLSSDSYLGSTITSTVSAANVAANAPATAADDDNASPAAFSQTPPSSTSSPSSSSSSSAATAAASAVASHLPSFASLADDDLRIAPPSGPRPLYHSRPLPSSPSSSTSTSTSPSAQSGQTLVASPPLPPKTTADTSTASSSSSPSSSTTSATLKTPSFPPAVTMTPFSSFSSPSSPSSSSSSSSSSATSPLSTPGGNSPTPVPIESITVKALQLPPPSFAAGAFAGAFTSAILHPLDLLKLRMQGTCVCVCVCGAMIKGHHRIVVLIVLQALQSSL